MSVRWYLAYPLSTRHVEELMAERGVELDHATINRWVIKYRPMFGIDVVGELSHRGQFGKTGQPRFRPRSLCQPIYHALEVHRRGGRQVMHMGFRAAPIPRPAHVEGKNRLRHGAFNPGFFARRLEKVYSSNQVSWERRCAEGSQRCCVGFTEYFVDGRSSDIELLGDGTGPKVLGFHGQHLPVVHGAFAAKLHALGDHIVIRVERGMLTIGCNSHIDDGFFIHVC